MSSSPDKNERHPRCSFCDKSFLETRLVTGPNAYICEECTELCWDIFFGGKKDPPPKVKQVEPLHERLEKYRKSQEKKD